MEAMVKSDLEFFRGKRVFVTGHTGFKGSWLCKILINAGAVVTGYSGGCIEAQLKNKFLRGQELDCLEPGKIPFKVSAEVLFNGDGQPIESAPHPMMTVKIPFERKISVGAMLRMKAEE